MAKKYWIFKSEPSEFGIDDLARKGSAFWDGVRNYQVRNMFRDALKEGDRVLFYHSNTQVIGMVGEMEIAEPAKPDPTQFVIGHKYYDAKSLPDSPRWLGPVVRFVAKFSQVVTLDELRSDAIFADLPFVKKGNRLSCIPITKEQYRQIIRLSKRK